MTTEKIEPTTAKQDLLRVTEPVNPERQRLKSTIGGLVITGAPGTGKSTLRQILGERYGIPQERRFSVGALVRRIEGEGFGGARERDTDYDEQRDAVQQDLFRTVTPETQFVLDSWLGAVFVTRLAAMKELPLPIIRILLYGDPEVTYRRSAERDAKEKRITVEQAIEDNKRRLQADWNQWQPHYGLPQDKESFYRPNATDSSGKQLYDITVDVTTRNPQEVAEAIHQQLLEMTMLEKVMDENQEGERQIFPKPPNITA